MEPDTLKQAIQRNYAKLNLGAKKSACPKEETLGAYLERRLSSDILALVESHLASCSVCAEQVVLLSRVEAQSEAIQVPRHLIARAKNLIAEKSLSSLLEIILRFGEDFCEVIRTTGEILQTAGLTPIPVSVRGEAGTERTNVTKISKVFGSTSVEVDIEKVDASSFLVKVITVDASSKKVLDDLRISLLKDKRELESLLTQRGVVVFKSLTFSHYKIKVLKAHFLIGEIHIDLRKA